MHRKLVAPALIASLMLVLAACVQPIEACIPPYQSKEIQDACRELETPPAVTGPDAWGK